MLLLLATTPSLRVCLVGFNGFQIIGFTGFLDICIKLKKLHITAKSRGLACRAPGEPLNWGGLVNHGQTMKTPPEPLKTLGKGCDWFKGRPDRRACLCQTTASGEPRFLSLEQPLSPNASGFCPPPQPGQLSHPGSIPELLTTRHRAQTPCQCSELTTEKDDQVL